MSEYNIGSFVMHKHDLVPGQIVTGDGNPPAGGDYVRWFGDVPGDSWGLPYSRDVLIPLATLATRLTAVERERDALREGLRKGVSLMERVRPYIVVPPLSSQTTQQDELILTFDWIQSATALLGKENEDGG